jgi:hypothetical protein
LSREDKSLKAQEKLEESQNLLEKFRIEFRPLTVELDNHLNK